MSTAADLQVSLANAQGTPLVYVGEANTLTVTLTNNSAPVTLSGGTPQYPPVNAFSLVLDFSALVGGPGQESLSISADGWSAQFFDDPSAPAWVVCPDDDVVLGSVVLTVGNLTPAVSTGTYFVEADLYNLDGLPPQPNTLPTGVGNPPTQPQNLNGVVTEAVKDGTPVFITKVTTQPYTNSLRLRLINDNGSQPLVPDSTPWGANAPQFILSFVTATDPSGDYALTTPDLCSAFSIGLGDKTTGWSISPDPGGNAWLLSPDPTSNHEILGTGVAAIAEFSIDNIVTQFVPGPTLLYVQTLNIPGYNDTFLTAVIEKEYAPMEIVAFSANQTTPFTPAETAGVLNWTVDNAMLVELNVAGPVPPSNDAFDVDVLQNQSFVLTAYDPFLGTVLSQAVNVTVDPPISQRWMPSGLITAWSGTKEQLPPGLVACDGTNGTPNLQDQFILGAGLSQQPGISGSSSHTHTLDGLSTSPTTSTGGDHSHVMPAVWNSEAYTSGSHEGLDLNSMYVHGPTQNAGSHSHSVSIAFPSVITGANSGGLRPAWYALLYVMEVFPSS